MKLGFLKRLVTVLLLPAAFCPAAAASRPTADASASGHPAALVAAPSGQEDAANHVVIVEKQRQLLFLYSLYKGRLTEVFRTSCSTGEAEGPKTRSGDKKTPEGVYFFTKEHPDRDLAPIYGSRAFPIDYPNLMDRLAGRSGNAIWLHGTNKALKPRDSNGCIVLENRDIDRLASYITLHRTPIIIVETLHKTTPAEAGRARQGIEGVLSRWTDALTGGTYHDYLDAYDPKYLPELSWWQEWDRLRSRLAGEETPISVVIENTAIYRHGDLYTILFDQAVRTSFEQVPVGTRKLFMAEGPSGWRIVGDEDQLLKAPLSSLKQGHALVAASRTLKKPSVKTEIAAVVDKWLAAWSSKDIDRYASFYARDFRSQGGADRDAWIDYKDRLNRKYRFIRVTRNDKLTIEPGKRQSTVSFVQTYASNAFKTTGVKKLILKREGNQWKIYREIFSQI